MFISNEEKRYLFDQIKQLTAVSEKTDNLEARLLFWEAKLRALEAKVETLFQIAATKPAKPKKPKKPLTLEQKLKQREYMRRYLAKKKAQKALEKK